MASMINRPTFPRRTLLGLLLAAGAVPAVAATPALTVYKTPWCGCCSRWVDRMRQAGFTTVAIVELEDLAPIRQRHGIADRYAGCHTGVIAGYALEGHVPPADVKKLLAEKPAAAGLAVPGMPTGAPGMEPPDGRREAFDTLLVLKDGSVRVYTSYAARGAAAR